MAEDWTASKQETGLWLFEWGGESGESFEVWLDGELLDTVTGGEYECTEDGYDDAPPPLEIIADESGAEAENELYPPYAILQWRGVDGAMGYVVEEQSGAGWLVRNEINENDKGYYTHQTLPLDDDTDYSFRVTAIDLNGNEGTPVDFTIHVVRNPAPPEVSLSIDGSNNLLVEEA